MRGFTDADRIAVAVMFCASLCCFIPFCAPRMVFGKAADPGTSAALPAFSVADFLVLVGFLSMANAIGPLVRDQTPLFARLARGSEAVWLTLLAFAANCLVLLIWIRGLRFMRRRGIQGARQRLLFQVLLHPLAILGPIGMVASGTMLGSALILDASHLAAAAMGALLMSLLVTFATNRIYHRFCAQISRIDRPALPSRRSRPGNPQTRPPCVDGE